MANVQAEDFEGVVCALPDNVRAEISALIADLKNENCEKRIEAMEQIPTIAAELGADFTCRDFIPYITELASRYKNEELLMKLSVQIGTLIDHVGAAENIELLIKPLKPILGNMNMDVRKKAHDTLQAVSSRLTLRKFENMLYFLSDGSQ